MTFVTCGRVGEQPYTFQGSHLNTTSTPKYAQGVTHQLLKREANASRRRLCHACLRLGPDRGPATCVCTRLPLAWLSFATHAARRVRDGGQEPPVAC